MQLQVELNLKFTYNMRYCKIINERKKQYDKQANKKELNSKYEKRY